MIGLRITGLRSSLMSTARWFWQPGIVQAAKEHTATPLTTNSGLPPFTASDIGVPTAAMTSAAASTQEITPTTTADTAPIADITIPLTTIPQFVTIHQPVQHGLAVIGINTAETAANYWIPAQATALTFTVIGNTPIPPGIAGITTAQIAGKAHIPTAITPQPQATGSTTPHSTAFKVITQLAAPMSARLPTQATPSAMGAGRASTGRSTGA